MSSFVPGSPKGGPHTAGTCHSVLIQIYWNSIRQSFLTCSFLCFVSQLSTKKNNTKQLTTPTTLCLVWLANVTVFQSARLALIVSTMLPWPRNSTTTELSVCPRTKGPKDAAAGRRVAVVLLSLLRQQCLIIVNAAASCCWRCCVLFIVAVYDNIKYI